MSRFRLTCVLVLAGAVAFPSSAAGQSTVDGAIGFEWRGALREPLEAPGQGYSLRAPGALLPSSRGGISGRSLAFFAQLTDAQLADEMSPARLEYLRPGGGFLGLWRPHEALGPQTFDQAVRNVNLNRVSRIADAQGRRARLQFALVTGDLSDNHQHNEVRWGVRVLEGGRLDPFSGRRVGPGNPCPGASPGVIRRLNAAVAARRYTGVQDGDDYPGSSGEFYDPDRAPGAGELYGGLPSHPGLMERAQRPFDAEGLAVPWYAARGNHDALAQGFYADRPGARVATGCRKAFPSTSARPLGNAWDGMLERLRSPRRFTWVPPDPARRFVSARTFKGLHGRGDRRHGFGMTPRRELGASAGAASYYAWSPRPGLRFVSIDTVAEGGGSDGNVDHPQYLWLKRVLAGARRRNELVVVYGHHSLETMANRRRDELAGACGRASLACDADPRRSTPVHLGTGGRGSLRSLLLSSPNVILHVTGHVHHHRVTPHFRAGSGFWQVTTASHMSFPQQTRLIELFENDDDTLSIRGTVLDTAAPVHPPAPGTAAAGLSEGDLGSISRLLSANVRGAPAAVAANLQGAHPAGNVELLLPDPRR